MTPMKLSTALRVWLPVALVLVGLGCPVTAAPRGAATAVHASGNPVVETRLATDGQPSIDTRGVVSSARGVVSSAPTAARTLSTTVALEQYGCGDDLAADGERLSTAVATCVTAARSNAAATAVQPLAAADRSDAASAPVVPLIGMLVADLSVLRT